MHFGIIFLNMSEILIIYTILGISLLIVIIWNLRLEKRIKNLTRGKLNGSIEETIGSIEKDLKKLGEFKGEIETYLKGVEKRLSRSIQAVGNENFNAFTGLDSGGNSFALAFLNEKGDGIIISTLHRRDRVSIFSKQITAFKPQVELSEEEQTALTKARKSCNF